MIVRTYLVCPADDGPRRHPPPPGSDRDSGRSLDRALPPAPPRTETAMAGTRCDKSRYWSTVLGGGGSPDPARPRIDFASSPATAASSVSSPASGASTPPYADIATAEVLTSLRYSASSDVLPSGPAAGRVGKPFSCGEPGCSSRFSHISSKYRHFRTVVSSRLCGSVRGRPCSKRHGPR
jgi:hypothetical protein